MPGRGSIEVTLLVRDWIRQRKRTGLSYEKIAEELGVKKPTALHIANLKKTAGRETETAFADRFRGGSVDSVRFEAHKRFGAAAEYLASIHHFEPGGGNTAPDMRVIDGDVVVDVEVKRLGSESRDHPTSVVDAEIIDDQTTQTFSRPPGGRATRAEDIDVDNTGYTVAGEVMLPVLEPTPGDAIAAHAAKPRALDDTKTDPQYDARSAKETGQRKRPPQPALTAESRRPRRR